MNYFEQVLLECKHEDKVKAKKKTNHPKAAQCYKDVTAATVGVESTEHTYRHITLPSSSSSSPTSRAKGSDVSRQRIQSLSNASWRQCSESSLPRRPSPTTCKTLRNSRQSRSHDNMSNSLFTLHNRSPDFNGSYDGFKSRLNESWHKGIEPSLPGEPNRSSRVRSRTGEKKSTNQQSSNPNLGLKSKSHHKSPTPAMITSYNDGEGMRDRIQTMLGKIEQQPTLAQRRRAQRRNTAEY